jgi:hypothetical protein
MDATEQGKRTVPDWTSFEMKRHRWILPKALSHLSEMSESWRPFRDSERASKPNWATGIDQFVALPKENESQRLHIEPDF